MPKTLRPPTSSSLRRGACRQTSDRPDGNVEGHSPGQTVGGRQVTRTDGAMTDIPSSSAAVSVYPGNRLSRTDVPDSCTDVEPVSLVPVPPPPLSAPPPPPAPPLLPGKLFPSPSPGSGVSHSDAANSADPGHGTGVPPCPPGPAPSLSHASETLSLKSHGRSQTKSTAVLDDRAVAGITVDVATIEAARLRLKKPVRTDTSAVCKF